MFKLMHLDDEMEIREVFSDLFSSEEITIVSLATREEAMALLAKDPPDLIFLDYRLPGTTGDQVAKDFQTQIPICLMTGDATVRTTYPFAAKFKKPWKTSEIQEYLTLSVAQKKRSQRL